MKILQSILAITALCLACTSASAQMFTEEQTSRGLEHKFEQVNFNGGGIAFVDLDADGDDDAYLSGGRGMDRILINDGNGYFEDITASTGISITDSIYTAGIIYGDVDNDGDQDLFVNTHYSTNVQPWTKNLLFINNGDLTFTESWSSGTDKSMTMGSVFIDYDLDGFLDIYNVGYVEDIKFTVDENNAVNGFDHTCFRNFMYHNNGNGTFTEVGETLNLDDTGCALAVTSTDYDNDGDMDIILGNDFGPFIQPNRLFRNDYEQLGQFTEVGMTMNADHEMFSMGIAIGDYDNDLDLDYYISNLGSNIFLENNGDKFIDKATIAGVENRIVKKDSSLSISWGTLFTDVNNDMFVDLFISNGYVPAPAFVDNGNLEPDKLYINNGDKTFTALDSSEGIWNELASRGCAYSDINQDGKVDIYSVVYDKPTFGLPGASCLYMNGNDNDNNYIQISLEGTTVNRNAYGSRVTMYSGDVAQIRELSGGASFCSHHSSTIHFGLGSNEEIDSIRIDWTGGKNYDVVYNAPINTKINIKESIGIVSAITHTPTQIVNSYPNPVKTMLFIDKITQNASVSIMHSDGRVLSTHKYGTGINVETVSSGLYYYQINDGSMIYKGRFIKI